MIPKGFEFYHSVGIRSMKIASLAITLLDQFYSMARVGWSRTFFDITAYWS